MAERNDSLGARINKALGALLLLQQAGGVDTTRDIISQGDGGHGKHGVTTAPPTDFQPLVLEWAEFFRRAAELAELDLAMEQGRYRRPEFVGTGKVSAQRTKERRERITRQPIYTGRRPEFVAYAEGCSVTTVKDVRQAARLDPMTGERMPRAQTSRELPEEYRVSAGESPGRA